MGYLQVSSWQKVSACTHPVPIGVLIGPEGFIHTPLHWRDAATRNVRVNSREAIVDVLDAFLEGSSGRTREKGTAQILFSSLPT
ncbi:hypothetical protein B9Z19DRAFT_168257 [Tuber borchii]|uniref:Uncharacterized protein n=1 Tax=Tuber borchii TaxID=42251 RepID=A0A2T6ZQ01_TUBBO|nr:hypothetical protein B9Z19DRAFT_168257 [Tuber borchii]